jgi:hypothetical protein
MFSRMPVAPSIDDSSSGELAVRAASAARLAAGDPDSHQRRAGVAHDRADVGEVEVDDPGHGDQSAIPGHLAQDVVDHPERVGERRPLLDHPQQPVVLDHDQRVDLSASSILARPGRCGGALEAERPRDDADGQRLELARELGDDGRGAGARAAASPAVTKIMSAPFRASFSSSRLSMPAAWPTTGSAPALSPRVAWRRCGSSRRRRTSKRLRVGVDGDEFGP